MPINYQIRYSSHPSDARHYDTARIREEFLVTGLMKTGEINMVYSFYDRLIIGGIVPLELRLELTAIDPLKSKHFLDRRELGIINVGGKGTVKSDGNSFTLNYKDALYIGMGTQTLLFGSADPDTPAHFYFNSAPAHKKFQDKLVTLAEAEIVELGSPETANARKINKLLVNSVVQTCQLQMGMTELKPGSVWNTMPPHVHSRRMEAYFYFEVPAGQAICHFMGESSETRHIWLKNEEAVISPPWSIHSAAGTSNYNFIWGMAGENMDYGDMDPVKPDQIR
jgi:4-deoxy-L-threo-5-hexosulose-uronate ketol-isomerase